MPKYKTYAMPPSQAKHPQAKNASFVRLKDGLMSDYKAAVFACGGSIPVIAPEQVAASARRDSVSSGSSGSTSVPSTTPHRPVTLRWDPKDAAAPAAQSKLTLPVLAAQEEQEDEGDQGKKKGKKTNAQNLERLLVDMKPASFGRGGEDVYDESYRKASKMDVSDFATDFCPYASGIIDVVAQVLLPDPAKNCKRGVKAELYKLNAYTGPSGHFRAHVDTPRSRSQFGSLVVCLPAHHEGGALEVRHGEQSQVFDWAAGVTGSDGEAQIQWAAFYSDCEHEVLPVASGHRVTLTYNLYVTRSHDQQPQGRRDLAALDIAQMPFYQHLEAVINDETFMPQGGHLGFYTTHAYPHTSGLICLPDTLKGLDMALWQSLQRLGCSVCLRPGLAGESPPGYYGRVDQNPRCWSIGGNLEFTSCGYLVESKDDWYHMLKRYWGLEGVSWQDILWLNLPLIENKQTAFMYAAYGNEASPALAYSLCTIVANVPKWKDGKREAFESTLAEGLIPVPKASEGKGKEKDKKEAQVDNSIVRSVGLPDIKGFRRI